MRGGSAGSAPALAEPGSSGRRWRDLRTRALSALILAPVALLCLRVGGWIWAALVVVLAAGLGWEWRALTRRASAMLALAGIPYIGIAAAALIWLRLDPRVGWGNALFVVLVVWASDIGAYAVGRLIGGPKLAPSISPGKTWSGALGGLLAAALIGALIEGATLRPATVAVALAAVAMAGDLLESALKRAVGAKDSGRVIPGHGGLLDRLDGLLAAAPVAALLAAALGPGVELWR